ncbi:MAG: EscF/YscF/HrpA family type III secretion system needle major subunit [Chthoniobacterales bacterium]
MSDLPTDPTYFNPKNSHEFILGATNPLSTDNSLVCTYGFNLNFIGAALFPQIQTTFTALQATLLNIDASNPAALLQVQLLMSEYENAVQSTSAMYASWETLLKAIIQNI